MAHPLHPNVPQTVTMKGILRREEEEKAPSTQTFKKKKGERGGEER